MTQRASPTATSLPVYYQDRLKSHVRNRVGSGVEAEDIAQETWVRALAGKGGSTIGNVRAYLLRVAGNLAIDHVRRRNVSRRYVSASLDSVEAVRVACPEPSAEQALMDRERQVVFEAILAELPDRCRQALILSRVQGWSHSRIADHLGVSVNTVGSDIRKALSLCLARSSQFDV
ncbi:MAG TPA: RNA polymerase sigma factor [Rhodopila sp.]|uniref:RNA polymerase sigma factor n=1 Tax=Rhodopila sp. TaxID=2480087 RepID=UPI002BCE4423|nr:RNA polymerase sigma factor [Rhodopila sp.]HVY17260.1 RNA polymerase sigma factor [Rhodopila sp.]